MAHIHVMNHKMKMIFICFPFQGAAAIVAYVATLIQYDAVIYSVDKREILSGNLQSNRSV